MASQTRDLTQYWAQLGDPVLTQLVSQGIASNLDVARALARVDAARAALAGSKARYLPQVTGNAGGAKDLGTFAQDGLTYSVGANATWEIDLLGRIRGSVAAARADLAAAGYSLADVQRLVVGQIAQNVIAARATAAQIAIARSTLANDEENLQIARWRSEAGLVSSLDVEQARTQRAQSGATVAQLEASLAATANTLSVLIGEPPGRVLDLLRQQNPAVVTGPPEVDGLPTPATVLRRRPDVRATESSLIAAGERVGVARKQLLPLVQLTGQFNTGATTLGSLFDVVTGGLVGRMTQLLFDGGATRAGVRSAEASARGALAAWRQAILTALSEVETAAAAERGARERVRQSGEALDAASNAAILARSQYQSGLTDFRTLLSAEGQLLSARNARVQAEAARATAFVQLTQALGGGWTASQYPLPDDKSAQYDGPSR